MIKKITNFYTALTFGPKIENQEKIDKNYKRLRWSVFISATIGYSLFYVCRLSLSVVKKPIVDSGILTDSEIGMIGSALFFAYAIGKLTNGFLADRSNICRFMTTGLLLTALINLALGFTTSFTVFVTLWGVSGWFQSMGAAPSVVSLSRWFSNKERGTYYGIWSASHGLGKAITFIVVAFIVSISGWQWGFWGAGLIGLAGAIVVALFLHDSPESKGLPPIADYKNDHAPISAKEKSVGTLQKEVLKNPYIWILALASALMYVSRYGIESWGIYYLEAQKGYTTLEASSIVSVSAVSGIIGTIISGIISDKFFKGSRNVPVLIAGILNVTAISLFLFYPDGYPWVDTVSMLLFGFAIGILITFVGGLMAVDIASKKASGAALGLIGIASYIGAGIQDIVSGYLIGDNHTTLNGVDNYDFSTVKLFWLGAAILSLICALFVWNAKSRD
ncbi:MFS transporter [Flavivirga spongiicola]|uniref:MFS transporter n=1 Tax=Flavivirga spongiicola TaxID=421621 RepID=A0ABU7XNX3_9FLAO|nr:MFS transporter [Flavivirga sp. MEBiC05379]MDO5977464.1 MFS transporter [Flavivirga sp. MEBiC05379]